MSATGVLPLRRRVLILGVSVLLLGGGARLGYDEVRVASESARIRGLEEKAALADQDRRLVIQLERELGEAQGRISGLEGDVASKQAEVTGLRGKLVATREELEGRLASTRQELEGRIADVERAAAAAKAQASQEIARLDGERAAASELAEQRAQAIAKLEDASRQLQASLKSGEELTRQQAEQLVTARAQIASGESRARALEGEVSGLEKNLSRLQASVDRGQEVLRRLKEAGVNVGRLSGERPMPSLTAVVVRVDAEAIPVEALIDVGSSSGVELKDVLYVIRDGREVAQLQIIEVLASVSRARLIHGVRGLTLRSGEDVTSVKPGTTPQ